MEKIVKILFCGDVDSGKSTLVGKILSETNNIKDDQLEDAKIASEKYSDKFEFAMLLDGLMDEREQNITIDIAHRYMEYKDSRIHILDCPGHPQYTKNMAIAAAQAEIAIIVIDATKKTITAQTKKHIDICKMFNIQNIIFAINKMDETNWAKDVFDYFEDKLKIHSKNVVPISALKGTNIFANLHNSFYDNTSIFEYIDSFKSNKKNESNMFFAHIISVSKYKGERYYYAYTDSFEDAKIPNKITVHPSNISSEIAIESYDGLNLVFKTKENISINRGDCIMEYGAQFNTSCTIESKTLFLTKQNNNHPLLLKNGTREVAVNKIDKDIIELCEPITLPVYPNPSLRKNNMGIIIDSITKQTVGIALLLKAKISENKNGTIFWLTGISGAGKTTIAKEIIKQSIIKPVFLDADELRSTVSSDLKYDTDSRIENNRRIGELAILIATQGFNVVVACISPFKQIRDNLKSRYGNGFKEIFINTSLETCKKRDPKGLYKSSKEMVGVNLPYEKPTTPDYIADTENKSVPEIAMEILNL